jgi:FlaG/FlaF family flagellin (archaellin)
MKREMVAVVAITVVLVASNAVLVAEYQGQQSMINSQSAQVTVLNGKLENQSQLISSLETDVNNLTSVVDRHGAELLYNSSDFNLDPATPSIVGPGGVVYSYYEPPQALGNFSFPYGGYVVISVVGSNYSGSDSFYVWTTWTGHGGVDTIQWTVYPSSYQYTCGDLPLPCVHPSTDVNIPVRIVMPVTSNSSLYVSVQNPEPNGLSASLSINYEY